MLTSDDTTVHDNCGDSLSVRVEGTVDVRNTTGYLITCYTPKQARQLARALKRAANVAEGKPAKKPKPRVIVDGEGDTWYADDDGGYTLGNTEDNGFRSSYTPHVRQSRKAIRKEFGIREERP
ncbi:hypothetical protein HPO96_37055 [Kribbella sandramycini]|uniref:Uncharacterized protein n=1 Tax=Kribbella sandramycini TaxID=60450 RepID=A0A7Y4L7M5_9ACTN|nr:hypothetical protein [Kribbella sandramycini]MBB6564407.1 hypothetical protein [Kribbella sandramycini]NOL45869.1 hypothetical protein [Kribbella sandramycini]